MAELSKGMGSIKQEVFEVKIEWFGIINMTDLASFVSSVIIFNFQFLADIEVFVETIIVLIYKA